MSDAPPAKQGGPRRLVAQALASVFGLGYLPTAPGTFGTLAALPLWWAMKGLSVGWFAGITLAAIGVAILIASEAERSAGGHDAQWIVIDEVVGMLVTVIGVPFTLPQLVGAFMVFRLLDITKPPPIFWLDRNVKGGVGVVLDDVAAGVVGCGIMHGLAFLLGGWW